MMEEFGLDSLGSGYEQVMGSCEHSHEHPGPIACMELLDQLIKLLAIQHGLGTLFLQTKCVAL